MRAAAFLTLLSLLSAALLSGCATVEATTTDTGRTLVRAENSSWRILWLLPLAGGDCETPNDDLCVWFRNTATLKNNMKLLDFARERKGARAVKEVHSHIQDDVYSFILRRTAVHTSAELVY